MGKEVKTILLSGLIELILILLLLVISGFGVAIIISPSMSPELKTNAIVITKKIDFNKIKEGDIIQFNTTQKGKVMHRVLTGWDIDGKMYYKTNGDANAHVDNWMLSEENYISKVVFHFNWFAPLISFIFGSFLCISKVRLVIGLISIGFILIIIMGLVTNGLIKIIKRKG